MKIKNLFLTISIFILISLNQNVFAEDLKISFVDMDKIIAVSTAGKKIQDKMNKKIKKKNEQFKKTEDNLKLKEDEIRKQKNVLSKEDLDKNINDFQSKLQKFRNERVKFNREINKQNLEYTNKMVNENNKILTNYAVNNSISIVIQKKNIIIGKSELDITDKILKEFNSQIKSID